MTGAPVMKYQILAVLISGEVLESDAGEWTDQELQQGKELLQDVLGSSKNGQITLEQDGHLTIIPTREIRFVRIRQVSR